MLIAIVGSFSKDSGCVRGNAGTVVFCVRVPLFSRPCQHDVVPVVIPGFDGVLPKVACHNLLYKVEHGVWLAQTSSEGPASDCDVTSNIAFDPAKFDGPMAPFLVNGTTSIRDCFPFCIVCNAFFFLILKEFVATQDVDHCFVTQKATCVPVPVGFYLALLQDAWGTYCAFAVGVGEQC